MLNREHTAEMLSHLVHEAESFYDIVANQERDRFKCEFLDSRNYVGPDQMAESERRFNQFVRLRADLENHNSFVIYKEQQDRPGLLHEATGDLAAVGLNMTSIHSYRERDVYRFRIGTELPRNSVIVQRAINILKEQGWIVE
jgi:hypothetical protein